MIPVSIVQAIINAYNDRNYEKVLPNIRGIVFLATPHRGANMAKLLSRLLSVTLSKKVFVDQLAPRTSTIVDINTAFPDRTKSLFLVSFWESTGVRFINDVLPSLFPFVILKVIVSQDSAVIGGERSSPLNGDHVQITKYTSPSDNNFKQVSGNIWLLLDKIRSPIKKEPIGRRTPGPHFNSIPGADLSRPETLFAMKNLSKAYYDQGRYEDALKIQTRILEAQRSTLPHDDPRNISIVRAMANTYDMMGCHGDALVLYEKVLAASRKANDNEDLLADINNLGNVYRELHRFAEAKVLLEEALCKSETLGLDKTLNAITAKGNLALVYQQENNLDESERLLLEALETKRTDLKLSEDSDDILITRINLANTYTGKKRWQEATEILEDVRQRCAVNVQYGQTHHIVCACRSMLIGCYANIGRNEDAITLLLEQQVYEGSSMEGIISEAFERVFALMNELIVEAASVSPGRRFDKW